MREGNLSLKRSSEGTSAGPLDHATGNTRVSVPEDWPVLKDTANKCTVEEIEKSKEANILGDTANEDILRVIRLTVKNYDKLS